MNHVVEANTLFFYRDGIRWSHEAEEIHHLSKQFLQQFKGGYAENCRELFRILKRGNIIGQNVKKSDIPILDSFYPEKTMSYLTYNQYMTQCTP